MCFTPSISLATAIIEFLAAAIILTQFKKTTTNKFFATIIIFLGFYQFTEFMLCMTDSSNFWARVGFITYTFLPAIALHFVLKITNKKCFLELIYFLPALFSFFAVFFKDFILKSQCNSVFILAQTLFTATYIENFMPNIFYLIYYFGFILLSFYFLLKEYKKQKDKRQKTLLFTIFLAILVSLLPAFIFILFLPSFRIMFPSIYCQFALIFTIIVFLGAYKVEKQHI